MDGLNLFWHKNGELASKGNHVNHLRDGQWVWWSNMGEIAKIEIYKNGQGISSDRFETEGQPYVY